ncbi:hypothetical protein [Allosphingosinicella sp.]|jgi:hypothetical protein|uniref:hypothetical protein n=1 Tax=Allosphingosinicella sp. TaxID=2823234 RepID=UPI002EF38D0E
MIATGFKSVGWVAGVAAAALGCYILSLNVAAERAELSGVERQILETRQAIRNLEIELSTRGRMTQLEQWNAEVLALAAPVSGQFVENGIVLARLETPGRGLPDGAEMRMASAEAAPAQAPQPAPRAVVAPPAQPRPAPSEPIVRRASLETAPARSTIDRPAPARSAAPARPSAERPAPARSPAKARAAADRAAPRPTAPARTGGLLDERTTRAIGAAAQAEAAPRRSSRREAAERSERVASE